MELDFSKNVAILHKLPIKNIIKVKAGYNASALVDKSGTVYTDGLTNGGVLGIDKVSSSKTINTPTKVKGIKYPVIDINIIRGNIIALSVHSTPNSKDIMELINTLNDDILKKIAYKIGLNLSNAINKMTLDDVRIALIHNPDAQKIIEEAVKPINPEIQKNIEILKKKNLKELKQMAREKN